MRKISITGLLILMAVAVLAISPVPAMAQEDANDTMKLLQEKMRIDKKLLVARNMMLTDEEGKAFWPVYDEYQKEKSALNDRRFKLIEEFAANFQNLSGEVAKKLVDQNLEIQKDNLKLMESYLPKFRKVVDEKKVARFYQIENKINAIVNYELAANIPLA
jgi:hypothetical protein